MNLKEYYTHEVNISVDGGFVTFPFSAEYYGEGDYDDGIENIWHQLFPTATEIVVRSLNQE